jgi:hypothetical protein
MAKPPVKPDRDSARDADWQMARHRERVINLYAFERVLRSRSFLDWRNLSRAASAPSQLSH